MDDEMPALLDSEDEAPVSARDQPPRPTQRPAASQPNQNVQNRAYSGHDSDGNLILCSQAFSLELVLAFSPVLFLPSPGPFPTFSILFCL